MSKGDCFSLMNRRRIIKFNDKGKAQDLKM